ncbi:phosphatidate cytidylyltransferase fragment [Streptococcus troglodytae]|uniref:Phosphatidate cytidylyltransferase n=1 Tax=Streptococcus troglodytae TaxID=1111760 RepID=A0A1L7LK06_9STRE|nr:phosphatidate cytidylyltransferase fragment [Streptococcus troglodytae]
MTERIARYCVEFKLFVCPLEFSRLLMVCLVTPILAPNSSAVQLAIFRRDERFACNILNFGLNIEFFLA